jgi:acyl-coenzyme A synthetase/AMP-(fatty) acid ligase
VERTLAELPGVVEVVVAYDRAIEAFVVLDDRLDEAGLRHAIAERLAPYKRPRRISTVHKLPRTATGKLVRSIPALRRIAQQSRPERSPADVR